MKVLVSGSSGLVGKAIAPFLLTKGATVSFLVRREPLFPNEIFWDPDSDTLDQGSLEGFDIIIHLAGQSIAAIWSDSTKKMILESRKRSTKLLVTALSGVTTKPSHFISASAIGYYGPHPIHSCNESSPQGDGFLASVCSEWEAALHGLDGSIITTALRFGIILSPEGGMLQKILPVFKLGLGGPIAGGAMKMSWVSIDDVCRAIYHCIQAKLSGPVNIVAPGVETNSDFTKKLASSLHRPAFFPVPGFLLKALLGQMAQETILSSCHAVPDRLLSSGFSFRHPVLDMYLEDLFRR